MKIYVIAGEASGDLHAAKVITEIKKRTPETKFRGFGGDLMIKAGLDVQVHYKELAFMGFYEVVRNLTTINKYLKQCKGDILAYQPDAILLVDYGGFNMRIAKFAHAHNIKVLYYILPKVWAWNQSRVEKIRQYVDKLYVILPFEKPFFRRFNLEAEYVGNPVLDAVNTFKKNPNFLAENNLTGKRVIAVLPGSRRQEIEHMLHFMLSIIPTYMRDFNFVVAGLDSLPASYYKGFERHNVIRVVFGQTYDVLAHADAALVTSGTATLETALLNVPQVVCYRTSSISYLIARAVIKVKYISLVNLIADKEVVKELIQDKFNPANLMVELDKLLFDDNYKAGLLLEYQHVREILGNRPASETTARLILEDIKKVN